MIEKLMDVEYIEYTTIHPVLNVGWRITHTCGTVSSSTIVNYSDFDVRGKEAMDEAIAFVTKAVKEGYNALPEE